MSAIAEESRVPRAEGGQRVAHQHQPDQPAGGRAEAIEPGLDAAGDADVESPFGQWAAAGNQRVADGFELTTLEASEHRPGRHRDTIAFPLPRAASNACPGPPRQHIRRVSSQLAPAGEVGEPCIARTASVASLVLVGRRGTLAIGTSRRAIASKSRTSTDRPRGCGRDV